MIRCGIYLRLSRDDGEEESNSIRNQRLLLIQYINEREDMELAAEWSDDGYSGSNYNRPGFHRMLKAAARGEIDCLLCKDLSRLGREYIQTGYFLRDIFPKLGIRFIAVTDHYDSANVDFMEQTLIMPVMNLMNDAYCRDISNKVRWQQKIKREQGEYIGAFPCYGYQKNERNHHLLEVDERVKDIVRSIYWLRMGGMSAEGIALVLNQADVLSPRAYKRSQGSHFASGFDGRGEEKWSPLAVRRILANRMYTGVMIQGKDEKISYKLSKRRKIPKEDWIRVPDKVPVIIPEWIADIIGELDVTRPRCLRGTLFCKVFAGYGLTFAGEEFLERLLGRYCTLHGERGLVEPYRKRMLFLCLIRSVQVRGQRIYIHWRILS